LWLGRANKSITGGYRKLKEGVTSRRTVAEVAELVVAHRIGQVDRLGDGIALLFCPACEPMFGLLLGSFDPVVALSFPQPHHQF